MKTSYRALNYLIARPTIIELEGMYLDLPKIFRVFVSNYTLGDEEEIFRTINVLIDSEEIVIRWENCSKNNLWRSEDDRLLGLCTLEELKYELQEFKNKIEPWHQAGMIKIGWTHGDLILIGMEGEKLDKIYLYGESDDYQEFSFISEDIFSLFTALKLEPDIELLDFNKVRLDRLYCVWDEDYWRIG